MTLFLINLFLAFVWTAITGEFSVGGYFTGFLIGYAILWLVRPLFDSSSYLRRFPKFFALAGTYALELLRANLRIAADVLTPRHRMRPAIVAVPLKASTALEITLLSNLITMTPGSLTLDVSPDRSTMFVHIVYCDDPDQVRKEISERLEARLLEVLR
jgi:multicomponent Na+:H+ antiporter subunit E